MSIAKGSKEYAFGGNPCSALGSSWSDSEIEDAMRNSIPAYLFDYEGQQAYEEQMEKIGAKGETASNSGFKTGNIVSNVSRAIESWMVGEAIAAACLETHFKFIFPWPSQRDLRNPKSNAQGPDLVGFFEDGKGVCFAFGEVKTSSEKSHPSVLYGTDGLNRQLLKLCENVDHRRWLIRYMFFRARQSDWYVKWLSAVKRFETDNTDFRIHGFLLRDVEPDGKDLSFAHNQLSGNRKGMTIIELIALYIPENRIDDLPKMAAVSGKRIEK